VLRSCASADALPAAAAVEAAWIRNAADWLDLIINKHWPEVDMYSTTSSTM
jgi:hypothetical protein